MKNKFTKSLTDFYSLRNDNTIKNVCDAANAYPKNSSNIRTVKKFEHIPGPRPSIPFVGTGWQYIKYVGRYELSKLHEANEDKYYRYGPILKEEYQWRKPIIHIFSPEDFEVVFRNQGKYPNRPPNEFVRHYRLNNQDKYPNVGLAHMEGEEWYKQRLILAPALMKLKVIQNHIPPQNDICNDFLHYLTLKRDSENVIRDLQDATYRLALESICMMCLDSRMGCLSIPSPTHDGNLLISATKQLFESYNHLYYGLPIWKLYPTAAYRKLGNSESDIYNTASKYVHRALNKIKTKSDDSDHESLLETLLKTQGLSEKDVKVTIIDFIAGGIFTVSNSLAFLLYHLATNDNAQETLFNEVQSVLGCDEEITAEKLAKLPYLKACIKESFRLTSPVPGIMRILPEDVTLSGYHVPAGTTIFSHFMVTCRLPQYFDDPLSFRPERWIGESRRKIHPFALLPFGHGNRMCAGRRFSELELSITTAKVIRNFKLKAINQKIDLIHAFIVIPAHPISIQFTSR